MIYCVINKELKSMGINSNTRRGSNQLDCVSEEKYSVNLGTK